jgi:hypothetical protein
VLCFIVMIVPFAQASTGLPMRSVITKVRLNHGRLLARDAIAGAGSSRPAIVGGGRVSITQAPWQTLVLAILSETEGLLCGGAILNETEILTAAHCVNDPETRSRIPADQILVVAGTADLEVLEPGEQFSFASEVRVHPYYNYEPEATHAVPDDVAVLRLEEPLVFTGMVQPISLVPAATVLGEGTSVDLTGFGEEDPFSKELDGELHTLGMTLGNSRECGGEAGALFLCASAPNGSDCFGDSGSGLTLPGSTTVLVGVTDTTQVIDGKPCLDGSVGGFANVAAPEIRDFIVEDDLTPPRAPRGGGVSISGVTEPGHALSCEPGFWTNDPTFTYIFIDSAGGQILQQGASSTYNLTGADIGRSMLCQVMAANAGGTGIVRTTPLPSVRRSVREEEEEAAAAKKHEEEAAAAKKHEEEQAASTNVGKGSVAGFESVGAPVVPDAQLAGTALLSSSSGLVSIKISCPTSESSCSGMVTLRTLNAVAASLAGAAKSKGSILTLATGSFTVAGGKVTTVKLHLSAKARALLARSHVLRARATIVAHDPVGASHTTQIVVTLRAASARRGKA